MFYLFEGIRFHVLSLHYYSPILDTRELCKCSDLLVQEHPMYGVDLREDAQLEALNLLKGYENEYYHAGDGKFDVIKSEMSSYAPINALALYSLVRHIKPKRVIGVGAGICKY